VGGVIPVVLVRERDRWVAYFATDPELSVASILEAVSDRSAMEQVFCDVKEVHGAGQQQLRHAWANVGALNLIRWWHTLVEMNRQGAPQIGSCDTPCWPSKPSWSRRARLDRDEG
jgi:hypothetical protein